MSNNIKQFKKFMSIKKVKIKKVKFMFYMYLRKVEGFLIFDMDFELSICLPVTENGTLTDMGFSIPILYKFIFYLG
jgi:hypothetical protein